MSDVQLKKPQDVVAAWWCELQQDTGQSRAYRAQLRRAATVQDALMHPFTHALCRRVKEQAGFDLKSRSEVLGALAMSLAHVKESSGQSLPRLMGQGDPKPVSGLRFEKIIRAQTLMELAPLLRRVLPLVGHTCNVTKLAADLMYWSDETRQDWCFDYYNAIPLDAGNSLEEGQDA